MLPNCLLLFLTITLLASHLKYPLFQSLSRFTETGFVLTKRNQKKSECSHDIHSAAVYARVWTPVGTGLSMPRDGAIKCQANAGRAAKATHEIQVPS